MPEAGNAGATGASARAGSEKWQRLVQRYGTPEAAGEALLRDAKAARARSRGETSRDASNSSSASLIADTELHAELTQAVADLERENADLRRQLPAPGAVVLTGDDVALWTGYKALGTKPDDVKAKLTEHATLAAYKREHEEGSLVEQAATLMGWRPGVLRRVLKSEGLTVELRDVQTRDDDNKVVTVKTPHVRKAGEADAKPEALADYAERELGDFLPALARPEDETSDATGAATSSNGTSASNGKSATGAITTRVAPQRTNTGTAPTKEKNAVGTVMQSRYAVPARFKPASD